MLKIPFDRGLKIHFIGIGGISMSGIAEILLNSGYKLSGSDRSTSKLTDHLKSLGAEIHIGHAADNIKGAGLVVYTAAISDDNPELQAARESNIHCMDRAEFLGKLMKSFPKCIAVSGTHGKTTATSMLSLILLGAELDPTIMVGGELDAIGGNVRAGNSEFLIAEACEYKGSFLKFYPFAGIILNIDADHLDYYKDIDDIQQSFKKFSELIPQDGILIGYAEDTRVAEIMNNAKCRTISYGINSGKYTADNISYNNEGFARFTALKDGSKLSEIELSVPGKHNILNALSAIACADYFGVSPETIAENLKLFCGTHRRFELKGKTRGITVIDDYAHHPTEIEATLSAARNYPHRKLYCIFQPHTYSRTLSLFNEFSKAFSGTDKLILLDIYAAREKDNGKVNSQMLCSEIIKNGTDAVYKGSFEEAIDYLKDNLKEGDVLITMGAGDVYKAGELFLSV